MKRVFQIIALLVLGLLVWLGIRLLFPDDETVIRRQLTNMAETASYDGEISTLAKASKATGVAAFFTSDAQILVKPLGERQFRLSGRIEIRDAMIGVMSSVASVELSIKGLEVSVEEDRASAVVLLSLEVRSSRGTEPWRQDFKVEMLRQDRDWLIRRIDTLAAFRL